jgi:hypothetical protein
MLFSVLTHTGGQFRAVLLRSFIIGGAVFLEEYYQEHPEERRRACNNEALTADECESEQTKFKMMMTRPMPQKAKKQPKLLNHLNFYI